MNTDTELKLLKNYFFDEFNKYKMDKFERAKILKRYKELTKLSNRELSKELNIPHSTIHDWLLWDKITKQDHKLLLDNGYSDKHIYQMLRNNDIYSHKKITKEEKDINTAICLIRPLIHKVDNNPIILEKLDELQNCINRIKVNIRIKAKND